MPILKQIRRFLRSEDGPTAVEYAVMLAMILLMCFASVQAFGVSTAKLFQSSAAKL